MDNLIAVSPKTCDPDPLPTSGIYVNDLPGITLKIADAGVDEETKSGVQLIKNKIRLAENDILNEIRTHLLPLTRANNVVENDTVGFYKQDLDAVAAQGGKYKGIRVRIDEYPYLNFHVNSISLKLDAVVSTTIRVFDLLTGIEIDTISITTVVDTPTQVVVNRTYPTDKQRLHLLFVIDAGVAGTYTTSTNSAPNTGSCFDCASGYSNRYINFDGASIDIADQIIDNNVDDIAGTNGMSMNYSLSCDMEPFICNMSNVLAYPMWYKTGAELMLELQVSKRLNTIVTVHAKTVEFLQQYYEGKFNDLMHGVKNAKKEEDTRDHSGILRNIILPDDVCFNCEQVIHKTAIIP